MRERFLIALAVTGGAYAIAFVSPAWTPSTKRQSPRGGGLLNAQTLTLDAASYMIPHPEKAAKGRYAKVCTAMIVARWRGWLQLDAGNVS